MCTSRFASNRWSRSPGYFQDSDSIWMGLGRRHARNGKNIHNSASPPPPSRLLYSQLLLQDFNKDFMLISKHTESCRLNIVSWLAAGAVAVAVAAVAAATILWLWLPAAVLLPLSGGRVLAHSAAASLPFSLPVTHNYSGRAARCR